MTARSALGLTLVLSMRTCPLACALRLWRSAGGCGPPVCLLAPVGFPSALAAQARRGWHCAAWDCVP